MSTAYPHARREMPDERLCSMFAFNADSLFERMHVCLDPDLTSRVRFVYSERAWPQW